MPKSTSSNVSSQAQKARRKQIEKLKQFKYNVTTINDAEYQVDFILKLENGQYPYSIRIHLSPGFPSEAPMLFVHPPCSHKYLDDAAQVVTSFPPLEGFRNKPDLANVVKRLISEFEKNPPVPLVVNPYPVLAYPAQYPSQMNERAAQYNHPMNERNETQTSAKDEANAKVSSPAYSGPKLPDILPELEDLSAAELKELDEDEIQLLGVLQSTELIKNMRDEREEISKRIEEVANENLSYSEQLEKCREKFVKNLEQCQKLKEEYETNVKKLAESSEWMSLNNLSLTVQVSAAEQEEKAEKMVEQFLDGKLDVNEFTKQFIKTKSLAVTRKVQEDKIQHILASQ